MEISRHRTDFWIKNNWVDVSVKEIEGSVAVHWHEFYEIEVILEGEGVYTVDGKEYTIGKGLLFFMSPSSCHSISFTARTKLINIMFVMDACLPDFLYGLFEKTPHGAWRISDEDVGFFYTLAREMSQAGSRAYLSALLNSVLGKINCLCGVIDAHSKNTAMQKAVLYVQNHFKEKITLEEVASIANYSPNYFGNRFKSYTGKGLKEYIMALRFSLAEQMLVYSDLSVSEICYRCGFGDLSNFMMYFKKRRGMTPSEYRKSETPKNGR